MTEKICKWCKESKNIEENFYIRYGMKDGHLNKCKDCIREANYIKCSSSQVVRLSEVHANAELFGGIDS